MDNVAFVKSIYDAFSRGDVATVLGAMSPDIRWHQAEGNPYQPDGAAWIGPQTIVEKLFISLGTEWENFAVHVQSLRDAGDHVVMEGRYTGTYKPSGKNIDAQVCHVLRFEGGREHRAAWDGEARWKRYRVEGGPRLIEAVVDPGEKILLDADRTNNGRRTADDPRAASRWTSRAVFWVQNMIDFMTVLW